jgi:Ser/Thr protein kinase RdoA (MazF antagonist)
VGKLPRGADSYGLIHADPEPWNMLLHNGEITFVDFDECCYHWFVFDLAVALMYAVWVIEETNPAETDDLPQHVWDHLYQGYRVENPLSVFWIRQLPVFMRLRVMEDYAFHVSTWDGPQLEEWQQRFLGHLRHIIESGEAVLNIAFD